MAVLSTLLYRTMPRLQASKTFVHHQVLDTFNDPKSVASYARPATFTSPSVSNYADFTLGMDTLHGATHHTHAAHPATSGVTDFRYTGSAHEPTPLDGPQDEAQYCSDCGDGPYGKWQVSCAQPHTLIDPYTTIGRAPMDGPEENVWFCSNCGDGPIGDWQNVCQSCQHKR
jgi:hypothetical protein